jgi:uncharacterized protein YcfJ
MIKAIVITLLVIPLSALAEGSISGSPISSTNNAESTATSTNNAQSINFNTAPADGTFNTLRTTVQPVMGGFSGSFSSDYCGATMQASAGAVGFGFSAGGPKIDTACVMLRTFERTQQAAAAVAAVDPQQAAKLREAALEILGLVDPKVRGIFEKKGLIKSETIKPVSDKQTNSLDSTSQSSLPVAKRSLEAIPTLIPIGQANFIDEVYNSTKVQQDRLFSQGKK